MKRKILSLILVFAITVMMVPVAFASVSAIYTNSKIIVDGSEVGFEAYNIGGNNYFKLRDVAMAISGTSKQFEVSWNKEKNAVEMTSNASYTQTGGELVLGDGTNKNATPGTQSFSKDGEIIEFTAYNIKGNNYIKLRDLGEAFNFEVYWDGKNNSVIVDTSLDYTGVSPITEEIPEEQPEQKEEIPYYKDFPNAIDVGAVMGMPVLETVRENTDLGYVTMYVYEKRYVTDEGFSKYIDILTQEEYYYVEYETSIVFISQNRDVVIVSTDDEYFVLGIVEEKLSEDIFNAIKKNIEEQSA